VSTFKEIQSCEAKKLSKNVITGINEYAKNSILPNLPVEEGNIMIPFLNI